MSWQGSFFMEVLVKNPYPCLLLLPEAAHNSWIISSYHSSLHCHQPISFSGSDPPASFIGTTQIIQKNVFSRFLIYSHLQNLHWEVSGIQMCTSLRSHYSASQNSVLRFPAFFNEIKGLSAESGKPAEVIEIWEERGKFKMVIWMKSHLTREM